MAREIYFKNKDYRYKIPASIKDTDPTVGSIVIDLVQSQLLYYPNYNENLDISELMLVQGDGVNNTRSIETKSLDERYKEG